MNNNGLFGYAGEILRVDLTNGKSLKEPTKRYARNWLGGRGINQRLLYKEVKPWMKPFDPSNKVLIGTGPLTGTLTPGASRLSLATKNVFSQGVGAANCDSHLAPELKFAGYDHIILQGRSRKAVYLFIDDATIEVCDASRIWGKTTWETEDLIKEELGDDAIQIICIGPAGENLVKAACVIANKNRAAGRCGIGAVLGSKNLKAIAVRGTGSVRFAHPDTLIEVIDEIRQRIAESHGLRSLIRYGTHAAWVSKNNACSLGVKNFQDCHLNSKSANKLVPEVFQRYKIRDIGYLCPIHCSQLYKLDEGPYSGLITEGFELNTSANLGGKLAIEYPPATIKGHALCSQLGLDIDNATGVVSWAFECYQRKLLTEEDTDGLKLEWGDYEVVFKLFEKIAYRDGIGDILGEGSLFAAEYLDRGRDFAITMKGQELYEEIRLPVGWGLGTCVSTRGGGHTTGSPVIELRKGVPEICEKVYGITTWNDPTSYEGKAKLVLYTERMQSLVNSLILCMFFTSWLDPALPSFETLGRLYSAATGWDSDEKDLIRIADRIINVEKAFNVIHGNLGREDDYPHERFLKEPVKSGRFQGFHLSKEKYGEMLDEYYTLHQWDPRTGLPKKNHLISLGLHDVAADLEEAHKIAG